MASPGGWSRAAGLVLGGVGLDDATIGQALLQLVGPAAEPERLRRAIREYSLLEGAPLLGVLESRPPFDSGAPWVLPKRLEADLSRRAPGWAVASSGERTHMVRRLREIDWAQVGAVVDAAIRSHLSLPRATPLSYTLFGSTIWEPWRTPGDLDVAVVVEDDRRDLVEVGAHHIEARDLREAFPEDACPAEPCLDVSIVGRGALRRGSVSRALANIACWTHKAGICLHGHPLTSGVGDYHLLADVVVTLGFGLKKLVLPGTRDDAAKRRRSVRLGLQTCRRLAPETEARAKQLLSRLPSEFGLEELAWTALRTGELVAVAEKALKRGAIRRLEEVGAVGR